jgi:DNA-binding beta-propeller fold protein YncE
MAFGAEGNLYLADSGGAVQIVNLATQTVTSFLQLDSGPSGMAIDKARGHIYLSEEPEFYGGV